MFQVVGFYHLSPLSFISCVDGTIGIRAAHCQMANGIIILPGIYKIVVRLTLGRRLVNVLPVAQRTL